MMSGSFREYSWKDIQRLIFKDVGLETEEEQRTRGQLWSMGSFRLPEHAGDFCIQIQVYDKPYSERLREHMGEDGK